MSWLKRVVQCVILSVLLIMAGHTADAAGTSSSIFQSNTAGSYGYRHNLYAVYPEVAYLQKTKQGYERVEVKETQEKNDLYTIKGSLVIEEYDENYTFLSAKELSLELPRFGGCYLGENYNFVICGQSNTREDDEKEVIRVVKYSKEWERLGSAPVYGANTTVPFSGGKVSCAEKEGMLYVWTCHEMYTSSDGLRHQSNMSLILDIETMKLCDADYEVSVEHGGYVSHSFNQFILADGEDIITLDHGDAYPRAAVLCKFPGIQSSFTGGIQTELLTFRGETGNNYTGAELGGLAASDSSYLAVGNYLREGEENRSIFLSVVPKNQMENHQLSYLTEGKEAVSTPKLVKIDGNRFLILWNIKNKNTQILSYIMVDGQGKKLTEIINSEENVDLSDCQPIVSGNKVIWYSTRNSVPHFYEIDINTKTLSKIQKKLSVKGVLKAEGTYGDALGDITIQGNMVCGNVTVKGSFSWTAENPKEVYPATGKMVYKARFLPADLIHYEKAENLDVTVAIAERTDPVPISLKAKSVKSGDKVTVKVFVGESGGIYAMDLSVAYPAEKLSYLFCQGKNLGKASSTSTKTVQSMNWGSWVSFSYEDFGNGIRKKQAVMEITFQVKENAKGKAKLKLSVGNFADSRGNQLNYRVKNKVIKIKNK